MKFGETVISNKIIVTLVTQGLPFSSLSRPFAYCSLITLRNETPAMCTRSSANQSLGRVLKLQTRAARVILNATPLAPSVPLFNRLKWLPFYKDALISKCIIAYKRLQGDVPVYLNDLLKLNSNIHSRQTRYCNFNLTSPRYNRETEGGRTFTVTTCKAWNSLSLPVRQRDSADSLKKALWNEFFKQQQNLDHFSI